MRNSQNLRDLDDLCKNLQLNLLDRGQDSPARSYKVDRSQGDYLAYQAPNHFDGKMTTEEGLLKHKESIE
jgi:hypothetical protein